MSSPLPVFLMELSRIKPVDPITESKKFLCRISGANHKLDIGAVAGTVYDFVEIMVIGIPPARRAGKIR